MPSNRPTSEEAAWMRAHEDDNMVPNIIACCSICSIASTVFLALRIQSRKIARGRFMLDISDWLLVGGWTSILAEMFTFPAMALIKLSILRLYGSIFTSRAFRYSLWTVAGVVGGSAIAATIVTVVQCIPVESIWSGDTVGRHCLNYSLMSIIICTISIITDIVLLVMPIPLIRQLHISRHKKYVLMITFGMGSSACIVGAIRIAFTVKLAIERGTTDRTWENVPTGMLSVVEIMTGFLAASIPTYRPLSKRIFQGSNKSRDDKAGSTAKSNGRVASHTAQISAGRSQWKTHGGIRVTDHIEFIKHAARNGTWVRVADEENAGWGGLRDNNEQWLR
ncbi:hypothetical protein GGR52DRAFT_575346 [Hypoxylon sp. FL1284]|nr:hypothetical protein GGR52DRAFT_575346 [Hypoxylon sp. FL1284]